MSTKFFFSSNFRNNPNNFKLSPGFASPLSTTLDPQLSQLSTSNNLSINSTTIYAPKPTIQLKQTSLKDNPFTYKPKISSTNSTSTSIKDENIKKEALPKLAHRKNPYIYKPEDASLNPIAIQEESIKKEILSNPIDFPNNHNSIISEKPTPKSCHKKQLS
jgi:hypothetical protein